MCVQGRRTPALSTAQSRVRRATAGRPEEISRDEIRSLGAAVPALSHPHLTEPRRTTRSQCHRRHVGRLGSHRSQQRACAGREALLPRGPRSARSHPGSHRGTAAAAAAALPFPAAEAAGSGQPRSAMRRSGGIAALPAGSIMPTPPCRRGAAMPSAILRCAPFRALPARPPVPSASGRALPLPQRPAPRHGPQW